MSDLQATVAEGKRVFFALFAVASAAVYASAQQSRRRREAECKKREQLMLSPEVLRRESIDHLMKSGACLDNLLTYNPDAKPPKGFPANVYRDHQLAATACTRGGTFNELPASLAYQIFTYCEYHDVVKCQMTCKKWRTFLSPLRLDRAFLKRCAWRGYDEHVRGHTWFAIAQTKPVTSKRRKMYASLLEQKSPVNDEIERDVGRTLIHYAAIGNEQDAVSLLSNLLKAYAVHDPEVGYTQGMNFVAAFFLTKLPELDAYFLYYDIMVSSKFEIRSLFTKGLPGLKLRQFQFQRLFEWHLPQLAEHFAQQLITADMFVTEWYMTLFTYRAIPPETTARIWDMFLVDGWKVLHRVAIAILELSAATLLDQDFEGIIQYLKFLPDQGIFQPRLLLSHAQEIKITNRSLHRLTVQFYQPR